MQALYLGITIEVFFTYKQLLIENFSQETQTVLEKIWFESQGES